MFTITLCITGTCVCGLKWPWSSAAEYLGQMGRAEAERVWKEYPIRDYGKKWDARWNVSSDGQGTSARNEVWSPGFSRRDAGNFDGCEMFRARRKCDGQAG